MKISNWWSYLGTVNPLSATGFASPPRQGYNVAVRQTFQASSLYAAAEMYSCAVVRCGIAPRQGRSLSFAETFGS